MAQKVITLGNIIKLVEKKTGKKQQSIHDVVDGRHHVLCICDEGVPYIDVKVNSLSENGNSAFIHTVLQTSAIHELQSDNPYISYNSAIDGLLLIDSSCVTEEDLMGYVYKID